MGGQGLCTRDRHGSLSAHEAVEAGVPKKLQKGDIQPLRPFANAPLYRKRTVPRTYRYDNRD